MNLLQVCLCLFGMLALTTLSTVFGQETGDSEHWALLIAGSSGYENYRHQADVCHAYHIIKKNGIPDERIIVMMVDDIAYNPDNPFKGNIINQPGGPNVYPGVPKDYTGQDVTPDVFLAVLSGEADRVEKLTGRKNKVIRSGPNDRIFVYFADHGGPGVLGFPHEEVLHVDDLHRTITKMHKEQLYKQMVFYVEACESGSMFDNILESNINVYATTAANPDESSYAIYLDKVRNTYLGDVYSVMWMQDSDIENLNKETLRDQFKLVRSETNTSHVMEYGDLKMGTLKLADFQGNKNLNTLSYVPERTAARYMHDAVPSEEVPEVLLRRNVAISSGERREKYEQALAQLLKLKADTKDFFADVIASVGYSRWFDYLKTSPLKFSDYTCYKESTRLIMDLCPGMKLSKNDYALRSLRLLANLCETDINKHTVWRAVAKAAGQAHICA